MAWLAVNKAPYNDVPYCDNISTEFVFRERPHKDGNRWFSGEDGVGIQLPKGASIALIGTELHFSDGPINLSYINKLNELYDKLPDPIKNKFKSGYWMPLSIYSKYMLLKEYYDFL